MTGTAPPGEARPYDAKKLALATLAALGIAVLVLVVAVLPAEYGLDPTGVGGALGLTQLRGEADANATGGPPPANDTSTATATLYTYSSSFPLTTTELQTITGYSAEGETKLLSFQVTSPNVTRVIAELYFEDANQTAGQTTQPDTFEIELKAPHGDVTGGVLVRSDPKTGGATGRAVYQFRQAPYPRDLDARTLDEAWAAFARNDAPDRSVVGEWKARVTMVEAGGADPAATGVPLAGPAAGATDAGNDWKLTLKVETYALDVAQKPGSTRREDVTTFDLPPGGEIEYKLRANLNARIDYSWSTDGPALYYDFHGDRIGDKSGAFTRHKGGTTASDAGTFVAPFDGRHGWYWRNDSGQPVVLKLETRGTYDVIGRTL